MLDTTAELSTHIRTKEGRVLAVLKWPSEEAWIKRASERYVLGRQMGSGRSNFEEEPGQSDLHLYEAVKLEDSPTLTAGEAKLLIDLVASCAVMDCELGTAEAVVTLQVLEGAYTVVHTMRMPTADEAIKVQKVGRRSTTLPHGMQQIRVILSAWLKLYADCQGHSDDYKGEIPAVHREAVVRAVVQAIELEMKAGPDDNPN
jgi:hypothetical protein